MIFKRFHVVLFRKQHGISSKRHNGKVRHSEFTSHSLCRGFKESGIKEERKEHGKPWDDIPATRIYVQEELDEQSVASDPDKLRSTIEKGYEVAKPQIEKLSERKEEITPVVIVALHGDLANALNVQDSKFATWDEKKKGFFFKIQPMLAMVNYTPGQKLSEPVAHTIAYCDMIVGFVPR